MVTAAAQRTIDKGLGWLQSRQNDDGSFGAGAFRGNVAVCGLSGMAFMSGGSTPGRGPYGDQVARAIDYPPGQHPAERLRHRIQYNIPRADVRSRFRNPVLVGMLRHVATRRTARETLQGRQVDRQHPEQGRRMALPSEARRRGHLGHRLPGHGPSRGAERGPFSCPTKTIDRATEYVKRCQNPDGGFVYMLSAGGESAFPRSARRAGGPPQRRHLPRRRDHQGARIPGAVPAQPKASFAERPISNTGITTPYK